MKLIDEDYNPVTGITTRYYVHPDGRVTVQGLQDVEASLAQNQRELNHNWHTSKLNKAEGIGTKVASIPMGIVEQVKMETGLNLLTCSAQELKRFLNDSNYAKVRTAHGRI